MAKRNKRKQREEAERELTRKEIRLRERDRERNRTLYMAVGGALALALIIIVVGALYAFAYIPNSTLASVNSDTIATKDFWQRMRLERSRLINQLVNLQQLEQQFGQSFFTSQINQIEAQLQSPFDLGAQVLDQMIDEKIILQEAEARGISVSEDDVDAALREEIARSRSAVTEPQATETAEAGINATATATLWTPTPTPTIDASLVVTATATAVPTQEPLPASPVLSETGYTEGIENLRESLNDLNSVNLDGYREIIRADLVREQLVEIIASETVSTTEVQVHARHILINVMTPTQEISNTAPITAPIAPTDSITASDALTNGTMVSGTDVVSTAAAISETSGTTETPAVATTETATTTEAVSNTADLTATSAATSTANLTATGGLTGTGSLSETGGVSSTIELPLTPPAPVERTDAEARALAEDLRQQLLDGADFATLAQEYSDDTGSGANGGDLDWFGRGAMVAPFEEAAFSLEVGEISEPIKTQFGYHIIEVLDRDENRPKDEATLEQERTAAFNTWLQEKKTEADIERPSNLSARLPRDIR